MKKLCFVLSFFIIFFIIHCNKPSPLHVTYIANEGFLIESAGKKVMIDGLFGRFEADWCDVPAEEVIVKMEKALPPFDQIKLILVTHSHLDHFNAEMTIKHLENNPKGILICTPQVYKLLKENNNFLNIRKQVEEVLPGSGNSTSMKVSGIDVKIMQFDHSPYMVQDQESGKMVNRHQIVQNLGFLVNMNGHTIFHNGDAWFRMEDEYIQYNLNQERIDIAFVQAVPTNEIVLENLKPEHVVMMHVSPDKKDEYLQNIEAFNLTYATVFQKSMDSKTFE